jgi:hypothetical protein
MTDVVIASHEADARAAEAMEQHHAQLSGALATLVERLVVAASRGDLALAQAARQRLAAWCQRELVPHALAEEQALYPAAWATLDGRLLVDAMMAEHPADHRAGALTRRWRPRGRRGYGRAGP